MNEAPDNFLEMEYEDRNGCSYLDDETVSPENDEVCPDCGDEPNDSMDGDAASALASAGFGTDEDYCHDTPLGDDYYGGE